MSFPTTALHLSKALTRTLLYPDVDITPRVRQKYPHFRRRMSFPPVCRCQLVSTRRTTTGGYIHSAHLCWHVTHIEPRWRLRAGAETNSRDAAKLMSLTLRCTRRPEVCSCRPPAAEVHRRSRTCVLREAAKVRRSSVSGRGTWSGSRVTSSSLTLASQ